MDTLSNKKKCFSFSEPFVPTSFIQKMIAFFTQTTIIYVHPDVKVKQEGDIVHVLIKRGTVCYDINFIRQYMCKACANFNAFSEMKTILFYESLKKQ